MGESHIHVGTFYPLRAVLDNEGYFQDRFGVKLLKPRNHYFKENKTLGEENELLFTSI